MSNFWLVDEMGVLNGIDYKSSFNMRIMEDKKFELRPYKDEDIVEVAIRFIKIFFQKIKNKENQNEKLSKESSNSLK